MTRNRKRISGILAICLLIVLVYFFFINKDRDYKIEYEVDSYKISEEFNKDNNYYTFEVSYANEKFPFIIEKNYTKQRKLVKKVNKTQKDDFECISIELKNKKTTPLCIKEGNLYSNYYFTDINDQDLIKENNSSVTTDLVYYKWNGYGLTDIKNNKEYNVLKKERYNSNLNIQFNNYIIFPDYDAKHEFSKYYVFDVLTKKYQELKLSTNIDFNYYYMGYNDDDIYIFDIHNVKQYKINVKQQKQEKVNDNNGGVIYNPNRDTLPLEELKYNNVTFTYNNVYNYEVINNKIYYYLDNKKIMLSDMQVTDILYINKNILYFIVNDSIYEFNPNKGIRKVLTNFELNFKYKNTIYIF